MKKSTTATTKKNTNSTNRKNGGENEVEDEEETVLKINDIVLMSAIDAVDIDSLREAPRTCVSFHPSSFRKCRQLCFELDVSLRIVLCKRRRRFRQCPVLLCSIATAMPMRFVARGKNGAVGTKGKEKKDDDFDLDDDDDNVRKKMRDKGAALANHANNKYFPVQSRDERVFVLMPVFSKRKRQRR